VHRNEICPHGDLGSDHPALQECCNSKGHLLSWPAWSWRQRHYNPLKCWELLAQQHSITILWTGIYSTQDSCWPRILRSHVWDVTVCNLTGMDVWGEGITSICMANHTTTTVQQHCCKVLLVSAHSAEILLLSTHVPVYFLYLFNYASSLPNASTVNAQFIFQFSSKSLTYRNLMRSLRS